jgi:hypothetical protein
MPAWTPAPHILAHPTTGPDTGFAGAPIERTILQHEPLTTDLDHVGVRGRGMHDTDHTEFQDLLPSFKSGALDDVEWLMVRTHLAECGQCQAELRRPELLNRAAPKRISPGHPRRPARTTAPIWTVALGIALVIALMTCAVVYAVSN